MKLEAQWRHGLLLRLPEVPACQRELAARELERLVMLLNEI
jgi:hypothetical protein